MFTLTRTIRSSFSHLLTTWGSGIREGQELAKRYHTFSRMTKRDLARRGLSRHDVSRIGLMTGF